ncbi:cytochrome P450 [Nannocystis sp.]|uniref:cytochrome P450 n=1 Tax=Nannocystis sp. TaxID=1962667 RepID=UPI0025E8E83D|nr:cytochrome P450 [Nannocystis sp.]MBK7824602.1 cytochrome P450 [Nannocystis sp.]
MQAVSPSDHLRLRRLMNPAFSPKAAERLREDTRQIAMQALAALPEDEVVDLAAFADYIPLRVVGRLFAIPAASEDAFLTFAQARIGLLNPLLPPSERDRLIRIVSEGFGLIAALIAERRVHPGDDLLSTLIHHEEAGARLSEYELMSMVGAIIVGGSDTTVHTLRFMLLNLLRNPEQLARVRADTRLVGALLEETLRFDQFGKLGSPCYALEDLSIRGVPIARGQMVIPMAGAATHDPEAFERPEVFDIGRTDLGVALNFGVGPHVCLGVHLARMEANVVVPLVLEHFPEMTLAGPPEYQPSGFFRVMHRLPVRVRRAAA